ncbi:MAG: hypothetical protein FWE84_01645 [Firmicutes bacterium]|nr:hypothetical protein [Bacillota bacterium]
MIKNIWVAATLTCGIILCVFGNLAFAVVGVILGLGALGVGAYFLYCFFTRQRVSLPLAVALIAAGLLLIILCLFVEYIAYFLGGIIMIATGIILLLTSCHHHRLVMPFCVGCIILGVITLFAASFISWLTVFAGVLLIIYSGLVLMFAY